MKKFFLACSVLCSIALQAQVEGSLQVAYGNSLENSGEIHFLGHEGDTTSKLFEFPAVNLFSVEGDGIMQASDGLFYGHNSWVEGDMLGAIYTFKKGDPKPQVILQLDGEKHGAGPIGGFVEASNNKLYISCQYEGAFGGGTLLEYDMETKAFTKKHDFSKESGYYPRGKMVEATNGKLYGIVIHEKGHALFEYDYKKEKYRLKKLEGYIYADEYTSLIEGRKNKLYWVGSSGGAKLFEYDIRKEKVKVLHKFDRRVRADDVNSLVLFGGNKLYGTVSDHRNSFIFEYNLEKDVYAKTFEFSPYYYSEVAGVQENDTVLGGHAYLGLTNVKGKLYGATAHGGKYGQGVLFEYNPITNLLSDKFHFRFVNGTWSNRFTTDFLACSDSLLYGILDLRHDNDALIEFDLKAEKQSVLHGFRGQTEGTNPINEVVKASNGLYYGIATRGGKHLNGAVFQFDLAQRKYKKLVDIPAIDSSMIISYGRRFVGFLEIVDDTMFAPVANNFELGLFGFDIETNEFFFKNTIFSDHFPDDVMAIRKVKKTEDGKLRYWVSYCSKSYYENGPADSHLINANTFYRMFTFDPAQNTITEILRTDTVSWFEKSHMHIESDDGFMYGIAEKFVYGKGNFSTFFRLDLNTGEIKALREFDHNNRIQTLNKHLNNKLYFFDVRRKDLKVHSVLLYEYDPTTGRFEEIEIDASYYQRSSVLFEHSNKHFYFFIGENNLVQYDPEKKTFLSVDIKHPPQGRIQYSLTHENSRGNLVGTYFKSGTGNFFGRNDDGHKGGGGIFEIDLATNEIRLKPLEWGVKK